MTTSAKAPAQAAAVLTIGGRPQEGGAGTYLVHNPARPAETVGQAPAADHAQLDAAVQAARRAAPAWRARDVGDRVAAVIAAATTASEQLTAQDTARLYTREHGKVLSEAGSEIAMAPASHQSWQPWRKRRSHPSRSTRRRDIRGCTASPTALPPLCFRSIGRWPCR
ncbi:aldehyde dehydrogenase [Mycobacterium xenopi RIVM700367]|nr:aldehyde dehydrogenase [Mycobacterium xenopi RIVM700367]